MRITGKGKTDWEKPELMLYRIGAPSVKPKGVQCVLLRAPEMGLEPSLAPRYMVKAAKMVSGRTERRLLSLLSTDPVAHHTPSLLAPKGWTFGPSAPEALR